MCCAYINIDDDAKFECVAPNYLHSMRLAAKQSGANYYEIYCANAVLTKIATIALVGMIALSQFF